MHRLVAMHQQMDATAAALAEREAHATDALDSARALHSDTAATSAMVERVRHEIAARESEVRAASRSQLEQRMRLTHEQTELVRLKVTASLGRA